VWERKRSNGGEEKKKITIVKLREKRREFRERKKSALPPGGDLPEGEGNPRKKGMASCPIKKREIDARGRGATVMMSGRKDGRPNFQREKAEDKKKHAEPGGRKHILTPGKKSVTRKGRGRPANSGGVGA